jgi:hypothetical protein
MDGGTITSWIVYCRSSYWGMNISQLAAKPPLMRNEIPKPLGTGLSFEAHLYNPPVIVIKPHGISAAQGLTIMPRRGGPTPPSIEGLVIEHIKPGVLKISAALFLSVGNVEYSY